MQYYIFVFYWIFYISDKTEYYITLIPQTAITGFYIVLRSISWFYMKPKIWKLETKPKWKRDIELFYIDLYLFFNNSIILTFYPKSLLVYVKILLTDVTMYQKFVMKKLSQSTWNLLFLFTKFDWLESDWIHIMISHY